MIVGYDAELMTLRFTMVDASARITDCATAAVLWIKYVAREDQQARPTDKLTF
jgi:hypothetical protein